MVDNILRQISKQYQKNNEIDQELAQSLLDDVLKVTNSLSPILVFGTALGAIREGKFISHDLDIDIAVFDKKKEDVNLDKIRENDIQLVRDARDILTFSRDLINLDLYFFNLNGDNYECHADKKALYKIEKDQLPPSTTVMLGKEYFTVRQPIRYFKRLYGADWHIPQEGKHAKC